MTLAWVAIKFLSVAGRFGKAPGSPEQIGASAAYFPIVGLLLGLVLAALNRLFDPLVESEIDSAILITGLILLTGAIHLEGLQRTFDRLLAPAGIPRFQSPLNHLWYPAGRPCGYFQDSRGGGHGRNPKCRFAICASLWPLEPGAFPLRAHVAQSRIAWAHHPECQSLASYDHHRGHSRFCWIRYWPCRFMDCPLGLRPGTLEPGVLSASPCGD